jgi:hypothetical protein
MAFVSKLLELPKEVLEVELLLQQVHIERLCPVELAALGNQFPLHLQTEVLPPLVVLPAHDHHLLYKLLDVFDRMVAEEGRVTLAESKEVFN